MMDCRGRRASKAKLRLAENDHGEIVVVTGNLTAREKTYRAKVRRKLRKYGVYVHQFPGDR